MKPLRICLVIPTLDLGGAEKQLCLLASGLDRSRFEPHVLCLTRGGPRENQLVEAGVPYTIIGKHHKFDPWAYRRLSSAIRDLKPDLVHTWIFAANAYGRLAALRNGIPVILGGERCVDPWKRSYEFWIDRFLAKRTQGIITNSSGVVDFYSSHGIEANRFFVIPNGVALPQSQDATSSNLSIDRSEACRRLGIPPDRRMIALIGRLWPQKGHKDLFWAIELLRVARNDVALVVIGDGPLRQRLEHYRDQLRAADTIRIVGERDDVAQLLPHFDIVLNGSHYEGQSNVILEAMSVGLPVVATDIPGNRDLVEHNKTGFLFAIGKTHELAKILNGLLDDPVRCKALGQAARMRIEKEFSIPKMIAAHQDLYLRLSQR